MGSGLRLWRVGGGVIVSDDQILLVKNLRKGGIVDWTTPGGVIDKGETVLDGLTREVHEETGLSVGDWQGPLYRVEVEAPDMGFLLRAEAHLGHRVAGDLVIDDPDGIVIEAEYAPIERAQALLADANPWVSEPLLAHLIDGVCDGRLFRYRMTGERREETIIERL